MSTRKCSAGRTLAAGGRKLLFAAALALLGAPFAPVAHARAPGAGEGSIAPATIDETTRGMTHVSGLLDLFVDRGAGRVWLRLPAQVSAPGGLEMLYADGLRGGLGSNPVGLDRSRLGRTRLVAFRRVGAKVFMEEINTGYRALTESDDERRAVAESFATSIIWGGAVEAEDDDGSLLVDLTPFLASDVSGISRTLEETDQGAFELDAGRSAVDPDRVLAFPDNVEIDVLLTFTSPKPGAHVRETAPDPHAVTLTQHHSFVRLPPPGYRPRRFDPRAGSFAVRFLDYGAALDQPLEKRWIVRHRLEKLDPSAPRSRVKKPIVYYLDRGTPEPVRSALLEGARWWARAFEEAGFIDAYRVELLPEGVHPLDVRYNVIHWVHRSTRGWSYGGGLIDPRTGEMIKGNVLLGSLRVRQDRLLFEGLAGTGATGTGSPDDPVVLALARLRQLSAHEVGHTLGFTHNFAASTYGRASVMDYPAPLVRLDGDGGLDFSEAYATGVGPWDVHALMYAYGEPDPGTSEEEYLERIVRDGIEAGLLFITDHDARPAGAAQPAGNLWDNGGDPAEELERLLLVRRHALESFGEDRIAKGRPLALLQEVFYPVYFYHRYQLAAAAKVIGGLDYAYPVRGDEGARVRMIDAARQRAALAAILRALEPESLDIPESALRILLPRPFGHPPGREVMDSRTAPAFDALGAARAAARMAVDALLQPQRAARLVDHGRRDPEQPGLEWLIDALVAQAFDGSQTPPERMAALGRVVRGAVVDGLIALSSDAGATDEVRARADRALARLRLRLEAAAPPEGEEAPHAHLLASRIARHLDRPAREIAGEPVPAAPPPGDPIGARGAGLPSALSGCSFEDGPEEHVP